MRYHPHAQTWALIKCTRGGARCIGFTSPSLVSFEEGWNTAFRHGTVPGSSEHAVLQKRSPSTEQSSNPWMLVACTSEAGPFILRPFHFLSLSLPFSSSLLSRCCIHCSERLSSLLSPVPVSKWIWRFCAGNSFLCFSVSSSSTKSLPP